MAVGALGEQVEQLRQAPPDAAAPVGEQRGRGCGGERRGRRRGGRRSSSPTRGGEVVGRHLAALAGVRTRWSRRSPVSQSGYQSRSARSLDGVATPAVVEQDEVEVAGGAGVPAGRRCRRRRARRPSCRSRPLPAGPRQPGGRRARRGRRGADAPGRARRRRARGAQAQVPPRSPAVPDRWSPAPAGDARAPCSSSPAAPSRRRACSERVGAALAGADPDHVSTGTTQTLPSPIRPVRAALTTTSMTSPASVVLDEHLDPHLGHEVDGVLGAPVDLGVAPLPAVAAGLGDRQALDAEGLQRRLDLVELVRLDRPR